MKSGKNRISDNNGTAAVEFGLLLPLLIIIIFGTIEFGLLLFNKQMITNASREGARAGIVLCDSSNPETPGGRLPLSEIEDIAVRYARDHVITFGGGGDPVADATRPSTDRFEDLTVTVTYHYDFLVLPNFIGSLVGGTDLVAVTVMRQE